MNCRFKLFIGFCALLVIATFFYSANQVDAEESQELSQLQQANDALQNAFVAVLEAEQSGTNVTDFLSSLNVGADLLMQAELSYRMGDINEALSKTESVFEFAFELETKAVQARNLAIFNSDGEFFLSVVFSLLAGFSYIVTLFFLWKRFKQYHFKGFLNSQLEVTTAEA